MASDGAPPDFHRNAAELRTILGPELRESDLYQLLASNNNDVQAAVNAHFGEPSPQQGVAAAPPQQGGVQVARPVQQQQEPPPMVQVTVPDGCQGGSPVQVQTAQGLMQVVIPAGLSAGDTFLMRLPPAGVAVATPVGAGGSSSYPGAAHAAQQQPNVVVRQSRGRPIVVHSHPYYHPYGYGYHDPFLYGGMGLLGGMMIADAMWW